MPPKKVKKPGVLVVDGAATPHTPTLAETLSYLYTPRPFKNPVYNKNVNRRMKTLKAVLAAEREKEKVEREKRKQKAEDGTEETVPPAPPSYISIEAPPSILPQPHYCDITGLEAPYTDPVTHLRYHDKSIYELIRSLNPGTERQYLSIRGVNPVVK